MTEGHDVTGKRKWVLRVGLAAAVALVGGGAWAFTHLTELRAAYAAPSWSDVA